MNIPGLRNLPSPPDFARLFTDNPRAGQKLKEYLKLLLDYIQGVPGGFRGTVPRTIQAGVAGDAGTQDAGWMSAGALAPIKTGTPPNATAAAALEGTGTALMRADATIRQGIVTTKGDLLGYSTVPVRVPVGTNTFVLTANSAVAAGVEWQAPSGGGSEEGLALAFMGL